MTSGSANHDIAAAWAPPVRATLTAMITCEAAHAANSGNSGRAAPSMRVSATRNSSAATASGRTVQKPSHGPLSEQREGEDAEGGAAHGAQAAVHVEHPRTVDAVRKEPR